MAAEPRARPPGDERWSAETADRFLRLNGGGDEADVVYAPEAIYKIDQMAEEMFFLLEGGITGRKTLMRRFPFAAVGTIPEAVFERVGFFADKRDGTLEMLRIFDVEELNRQLDASPHLTFIPANNLRVHGQKWKDFQSMVGTLRAFSSALSISDVSDEWNTVESQNSRIRGVMKGLAAMANGTLLRDREERDRSEKKRPEPALEIPPEVEGIFQIAAALEGRRC